MKPFYTALSLLISCNLSFGQQWSAKDLMEFTHFSVNKFDAYMGKKEYKRDYYSPQESKNVYNYEQRKKKGNEALRTIAFQEEEGKTSIHYQTSLEQEKSQLLQQLNAIGFRSYEINKHKERDQGLLLQYRDMRAYTSIEQKDSITFYTFKIERQALPKLKDIAYAEDLLPLASHEYLAYIFGEDAVKKEVFYYSETETNKCSVLFPNTNKEVIFIWNDEKNYSNTAFMMLGGQLKADGKVNTNYAIEHNSWRSRQGIYSGMSLLELQKLNEGPVNFYGWHVEQAGMLAPKNQGKIDFNRIGLVLNCLNCNDVRYQQTSIVSSERQLKEERKIYVATIIILPEKEKPATASR
jgi:hypothetical protein